MRLTSAFLKVFAVVALLTVLTGLAGCDRHHRLAYRSRYHNEFRERRHRRDDHRWDHRDRDRRDWERRDGGKRRR